MKDQRAAVDGLMTEARRQSRELADARAGRSRALVLGPPPERSVLRHAAALGLGAVTLLVTATVTWGWVALEGVQKEQQLRRSEMVAPKITAQKRTAASRRIRGAPPPSEVQPTLVPDRVLNQRKRQRLLLAGPPAESPSSAPPSGVAEFTDGDGSTVTVKKPVKLPPLITPGDLAPPPLPLDRRGRKVR